MKQKTEQRRPRSKPQEQVESEKIVSAPPVTTDLLDEIDSVLETNAEDFVRQYHQRGGE